MSLTIPCPCLLYIIIIIIIIIIRTILMGVLFIEVNVKVQMLIFDACDLVLVVHYSFY